MRLDLLKIRENMEIQNQRSPLQRGEQPLLTLTCFVGLGVEDTDYCKNCCAGNHFEKTCRRNLFPYQIYPTIYRQG